MRNQNAERRISGSLNRPTKPAAQASVKAVRKRTSPNAMCAMPSANSAQEMKFATGFDPA